ncbi:hypothetical protein Pint_16672 [Pistacia integerrima]|uniref:Uncharacterized protein n=1 Tax=Pistacia integerrima TaxID=434235 RepID=A0ACC0ZEW9_9ROSI|nr:hypothetical protein Pint_16672 [Pistacia integerrima]
MSVPYFHYLRRIHSPFHLALEKGHRELVTWLMTIDSELVRVKGKKMLTPLHYAAQIDDEKNLAHFLYVCPSPSSIKDLTPKSETAVRVTLKGRNISKAAFGMEKNALLN